MLLDLRTFGTPERVISSAESWDYERVLCFSDILS